MLFVCLFVYFFQCDCTGIMKGYVFESIEALNFFMLLLHNCLNWEFMLKVSVLLLSLCPV